jgi:hypothetical protein
MENLIKAINKVMADCESVEKGLTVGSGNMAYKGVADKDVKIIINRSMRENGLAIFTTKIEPTTKIERWEEKTNYGVKQKQSVFTEVLVTYKLAHSSGESVDIQGYGHGIDSQDKGAGKATTYALKYALLYQFLVATGDIDDTDSTHSEQTPQAPTKKPMQQARPVEKKWITEEQFQKAKSASATQLEAVFNQFQFRKPEQQEELQEIYNKLKAK